MAAGYDTVEAAVDAAMKKALPQSEREEYAGVVYERGGKFYFTDPVSSGETHSVSVKVRYPKGSKLLGLYHTHPKGRNSQVFSRNDVEVAQKLGIPYYMGHAADGKIKVFDPKKTKVSKADSRERRRTGLDKIYALGDPFALPEPEIMPTRSTNDILVEGERPKQHGTY